MRYPSEQRVEVYAQAVRGLSVLEPQPEKQLKYLDFIDIGTHANLIGSNGKWDVYFGNGGPTSPKVGSLLA